MAIKQSIGKLNKPADLAERIRDSGFRHLTITAEHGIVAGRQGRNTTEPTLRSQSS